jgi:hypothetical protein
MVRTSRRNRRERWRIGWQTLIREIVEDGPGAHAEKDRDCALEEGGPGASAGGMENGKQPQFPRCQARTL